MFAGFYLVLSRIRGQLFSRSIASDDAIPAETITYYVLIYVCIMCV